MHFCIVGYDSLNQGCGAVTEISKLWLWLQASKVFGSSSGSKWFGALETENHGLICAIVLLH